MGYSIIVGIEDDLSQGCEHPRAVFFQCGHCKRPVQLTVGCGKRFDRFCPACANRWRRRTRTRYMRGVFGMKRPKFLTLTLKKLYGGSSSEIVRLKRLWAMRKELFRRLRRAGYDIGSWCAVIEPPNHVHLVMDSDFIPKSLISDWWNEITGDSFIVDLRQVNVQKDPRSAVAYVTKYLSKASEWEGVNLDLVEGFHIIGSWGLTPGPGPRPLCVCGVRALKKCPDDAFYALVDMIDGLPPDRKENLFGMWRDT